MNSEALSAVLKRGQDIYGDGIVHLLISWLKCSRILLFNTDGLSPEVLMKIRGRAFLKVEESQYTEISKHLDKNDLIVVPAGNEIVESIAAKVVGFGKTQSGWDGSFRTYLDSSATIYFEKAETAFRGAVNGDIARTKYLFLDRDGVIINYVSYPDHPSQVKLQSGIVEVIKEYRKRNHRIVMVTNQSGIARGYSTQEDFRQVQNRTLELLAQQGQWIDACYFATYLANSDIIQTLQYPSLRKPRTGMLAEEAQFWNIDLENSVMIGDNASDVEWAQNAGLGRVFWLENPELKEKSPASMTNVTQVQSLDQILQLI